MVTSIEAGNQYDDVDSVIDGHIGMTFYDAIHIIIKYRYLNIDD